MGRDCCGTRADAAAVVAPIGAGSGAAAAFAATGSGGSAAAMSYRSRQTDVSSRHSYRGRCGRSGCQSHLKRCKGINVTFRAAKYSKNKPLLQTRQLDLRH